MASVTAYKKYQLTINHPKEKGWGHENIKRALLELKSVEYFCLADEIGEQGTYHTHIFLYARSPIRFQTLKNRFPESHIESCAGSAADNRAYIRKEGKWAETDKAETRVEGSFFEYGELPEELGQGYRSDIGQLYAYISDGMSNAEIMAKNPDLAIHIGKFDKIRSDILEEKNRTTWRDLDITYIFGPTGSGKTRYVMDKHGYAAVCRITDYKHPFEGYLQHPVILFEEYRSSLPISEMLNYCDGYPVSLPARYANRIACYQTAYIISNIDLREQYPNIQQEEPATWRAFLRRIHHVLEFRKDGTVVDHGNATGYIFPPVPDWVREAEESTQEELLF